MSTALPWLKRMVYLASETQWMNMAANTEDLWWKNGEGVVEKGGGREKEEWWEKGRKLVDE